MSSTRRGESFGSDWVCKLTRTNPSGVGGGGGAVLPSDRLMEMCRWMGSHFHEWIGNKILASRDLEMGRIEVKPFYPELNKWVMLFYELALYGRYINRKWLSWDRENSIPQKVTKVGSMIMAGE